MHFPMSYCGLIHMELKSMWHSLLAYRVNKGMRAHITEQTRDT